MLDRNLLDRALSAQEAIREHGAKADVTVYDSGTIRLWASPASYTEGLTDEQRHKVLAVLVPLVGRLNKKNMGDGDIWMEGSTEDISVTLCRAERCKIVGYRTVTRRVPKMVEVEDEFEEETERVAITDCDLNSGRASESEIEERV